MILDNLLDAGKLDIDTDGNVTDPRDGALRTETLPGWNDTPPF